MPTPSASDPPDLDEELSEGEAFLEEGDLQEALMRAARALAVAPDSSSALAFAERAIAETPDALERLPLGEDVPFGIAALRARALAAAGRFVDASELAIRLAAFRPGLAYATWAVTWLADSSQRMDRADAERLSTAIASLHEALSTDASNGEAANAEAACSLLERIRPAIESRLKTSYLLSSLLRKLGKTRDALREAEAAFDSEPCWISATQLALALRDCGDTERALAMYRRALSFDPSETSPWLDMGDLLLQEERWQEAADIYEHVLAEHADDGWARASLHYARCRAGRTESCEELRRLGRLDDDAGQRAKELLSRRR